MIIPASPFPNLWQRWLTLAIVVLCCIGLVWRLLVPGALLSLILLVLTFLLLRRRPDAYEHKALRTSIALSAEDVEDVLAEYERFSCSPDTDCLADRTIHRPALMDQDCTDADISDFHYQRTSSRRFLRRLNARLADPTLEIQQLETLLSVTDKRAAALRAAWLRARQAAQRIGPSGHNGSAGNAT